MLVSPGLSVKTYLQKFNEERSCKIKIEKINGNCFSIPLKKIMIKPITKVKKIIPNTSDNPATAWLKKPKLFKANSSVKINN